MEGKPDCDRCQRQQDAWENQHPQMRAKSAPVEAQHNRLFDYPYPRQGVPRVRDCPHGFVYGCPVLATKPKDPRLSAFLAYNLYWKRGFTWEQYHREPPMVRDAMMAIEASKARRQDKEIKKTKDSAPKPETSDTPKRQPLGNRRRKL